MAQRRFGPVRGAGVSVTELEGDKPIEPGALGWWGYAGIMEKGNPGELIVAPDKPTFLKKCGSYIADSLLPDAAIHAYDLASGAGGGLFVRVTDGTEVKASAYLFARKEGSYPVPMGRLDAQNGGRWGGKLNRATDDVAAAGDITNITLDTATTMKQDAWKGGVIKLDAVANKTYPITGNTTAGVISVAADSTMKDDWTAAADPSNLRYYLEIDNEGKELSYEVRDGEEKPTEEFGLYIYVDGVLTLSYPNLSTDPTAARYWVSIINNDDNNDEVTVTDLWTGAHTADVRPANVYLEHATTPTETVASPTIHNFDPATTGDADGTLALGTTTDEMFVAQTLTITFATGTPVVFNVVSDVFGDCGDGEVGTLFTPNNIYTPPFTITDGASAFEDADVATLKWFPLIPEALIGGYLYPDKPNATRVRFRIVDNDHKTITVAPGSDLTADAVAGDWMMATGFMPLAGGIDGNAGVVDADYQQQAWDTGASPFNQIEGRNLGLVKFATPGVTATAVQKAGAAYAEAKNHQYRYEVTSNIVTEASADAYVNDTLGRSDFAVVSFPSYAYVADPEGDGEGKLKLVSCTGMIHGREARIANDYTGYHKAEAGLEATLPPILKLPTGDKILDEEYLNPLGINIIKKKRGNFILWGDRTLWLDPNWKWKHQREQMSYYEHVLQENFDWIIFMINDPVTEKLAIVALQTFFYPEWVKRALRGDKFGDAITIKIDSENNTDLTRALGDMNAALRLRLADTVERFNIFIGKMGIFESVA